jgi:hypothetical protein
LLFALEGVQGVLKGKREKGIRHGNLKMDLLHDQDIDKVLV